MKSKSKPQPAAKPGPNADIRNATGQGPTNIFVRVSSLDEMKAREGLITDAIMRAIHSGGSPHLDESAKQCGEKLAYEHLAKASQCEAVAGTLSKSTLIPSLVKSLLQELDATRKTVAVLTDRLAPVLGAPKKDVCAGALGYATADGAPSLANELSALGNGFYQERQAIEDLIARLQL